MEARHERNGELTNYGPFTLTGEERAEFRRLVERAALAKLPPAEKQAVPGDVQYTFVQRAGGRAEEIVVWKYQALKHPQVMALVRGIAALIKKYVGEQPVLE